jgi:hypothetical protein
MWSPETFSLLRFLIDRKIIAGKIILILFTKREELILASLFSSFCEHLFPASPFSGRCTKKRFLQHPLGTYIHACLGCTDVGLLATVMAEFKSVIGRKHKSRYVY